MRWENSFKKILWLKIMILPIFFSQKYTTSKLRQNTAVIFFFNGLDNSDKTFSTILTFYRNKKNANKTAVFLNVLSILDKLPHAHNTITV